MCGELESFTSVEVFVLFSVFSSFPVSAVESTTSISTWDLTPFGASTVNTAFPNPFAITVPSSFTVITSLFEDITFKSLISYVAFVGRTVILTLTGLPTNTFVSVPSNEIDVIGITFAVTFTEFL